MCGISGIWAKQHSDDLDSDINKMLDTLNHRGPDNTGVYFNKSKGLGFGHKRLSIIDLSSAGKQPMISDNKQFVITYNGEVYNFAEIKKELEAEGVVFISHSDTEVILKAFQHWGIKSIDKFRGMFAFAIWDNQEEKVYLVRDRAGVKPLYYSIYQNRLYFSSEPRAILATNNFPRKLNSSIVGHYLKFGYISSPECAFKHINTVKPGHYLVVDNNLKVEEFKYWDITDFYLEGNELERSGYWSKYSENEVVDQLEEVITEAIKYRMVADVPVGVFLSGGIDSCLVAGILSKKLGYDLKTFTIGNAESEFNEANHAHNISRYLNTSHTELYLSHKDNISLIGDIPRMIDEPFGDNSIIPTYLVSKLAQQNVKVALSGDGGDELFCGYSRFNFVDSFYRFDSKLPEGVLKIAKSVFNAVPDQIIEQFHNIFSGGNKRSGINEKIFKVKRLINQSSQSDIYEAASSYWYGDELGRLMLDCNSIESSNFNQLFKEMEQAHLIHKMMNADFKKYMVDDVLTKVDRASMSVSLEAREPLLDHKLAEFAARLPLKYKYKNGENKYILKKILFKYIPEEMFQRPKQGFSLSVNSWLKNELKSKVYDTLSYDQIKRDGIFDPNFVQGMITDFYSKTNFSAQNLWFLFQFQLWKNEWKV